jgi:protein CpxP
MNNMSGNRNLLIIIGVLLLTNIAVLVYFLAIRKPGDKRFGGRAERSGLTEVLKKEVGFNEQQVAEYKKLKDQQSENFRPFFDEMRKSKDSLFRLIGDSSVSDSVIHNAANGIAARQRNLDLQTFYHFRKVRELCSTAEQREKYDSAITRMFRKMGKPARKSDEHNKH